MADPNPTLADEVAAIRHVAEEVREGREFPAIWAEADQCSDTSWRDGYITACLDIAQRLERLDG